jgi:hypothetical protein
MRKWRIFGPAVILMLSISSKAQQIKLLKTTFLPHYPSASTLEYHKNLLYVIGDDAPQMLVLDNNHQPKDSLVLFANKKKRLSKKDKADLESSIFINQDGRDYLVAFPSFSTPRRDRIMVIDMASRETHSIEMPNLRIPGISDINIEGTAMVQDKLLLSSRANRTHTDNYLLVARFHLQSGFDEKNIHSLVVQLPKQQNILGISSISYLESADLLLFTASTENTGSAYSDGTIGDSYIGYIRKISGKLNGSSLTPDALINISPILSQGPHKIESLVVESQKGKELIIHLAADNDDGASTLFKLSWEIEE